MLSCLQVESLRQLSDAAGNQIGTTQARLEQLQADKEQQEQQLKAQLHTTQVWRTGDGHWRCTSLAFVIPCVTCGQGKWGLHSALLLAAACISWTSIPLDMTTG